MDAVVVGAVVEEYESDFVAVLAVDSDFAAIDSDVPEEVSGDG